MKNKLVHRFVIGTFVSLYLLVSVISTIHVIDFFKISNPYWLAVSLAIGFELGAAASLASLIILDRMNKGLVWALFIVITLMQMQGNMYYAFVNMKDFQGWSELFALIEEDIIYQKRVLAAVSGAILPLVALGFIKSLVDYIKPQPNIPTEEPLLEIAESEEQIPEEKTEEGEEISPSEIEKESSENFTQEELLIDQLDKVENPSDELISTEEIPASEEEILVDLQDSGQWVSIPDSLAEEETQAILEDETSLNNVVSGYYGDVLIDGNGEVGEVRTEESSILPVNSNKKGGPAIDQSGKVFINPTRL